VLKLLRSLVTLKQSPEIKAKPTLGAPPPTVSALGSKDFNITANLINANGLPVLDWDAAQHWVNGIADTAAQAKAWSDCERAWLEHMQVALGSNYEVRGQGSALLLTSQQDKIAQATLAFINKTAQRVEKILDGVAQVPEWGHDILLVFDDDDTYYKYVAHYYPEAGEFAGSSGMYINAGCGHFVTVKSDLLSIEPVIAHEMTHAYLSHLPIPAWLNEGIAVSTERRLCPSNFAASSPRQMYERHCKFWGPMEIQQFWSGKSFLRTDEGNELSYDLAQIIVSQFGADWDRFRAFVLSATFEDAGDSAAKEHLGISLGEIVCAMLKKGPLYEWMPVPEVWNGTPERGAFS
jgi:hypothetical protein